MGKLYQIVVSSVEASKMGVKVVLIIFSLQLWHLAMSNQIPDVFASSNELGKCVSSCSNFPIQIGNKLYHLESTLKVNWYQAVHNCRKLGGHLLNIESSTEMDLIVAIAPSNQFWVSASSLANRKTFISIATGVAMPYNRWNAGEPSHPGLDLCVSVRSNGLDDTSCVLTLNYVCQANIL